MFSFTESSTSNADTCCACFNVINVTDEIIQQRVEELKKTLHIDKKTTKVYKRSLISQPDSRTSAMATGNIFGTCVLSLLAALVILLDLSYLLCHHRNK
ncbi:hypothetical protein FSP39_001085 [Pinctada imbricata]|uniref:Uncharacterized protein n=1 Tax=Pinctada imbricata TaxID=66713 RepID=A0AA89BQ39_PINIB|nr:hypothetical protein FSP39_001085 [Pinctada imbricata]